MARLNTNRMARRLSEVHRLGDTWVDASVSNWDYRLEMFLDSEGYASVSVVNLKTGNQHDLVRHMYVRELFGIGFEDTPPPSPQKKARRGHRHNKLLDDALASLEDTA